jgi:hypothetical protein
MGACAQIGSLIIQAVAVDVVNIYLPVGYAQNNAVHIRCTSPAFWPYSDVSGGIDSAAFGRPICMPLIPVKPLKIGIVNHCNETLCQLNRFHKKENPA